MRRGLKDRGIVIAATGLANTSFARGLGPSPWRQGVYVQLSLRLFNVLMLPINDLVFDVTFCRFRDPKIMHKTQVAQSDRNRFSITLHGVGL